MPSVKVRYIVEDVDEAVRFYTERLGFSVDFQPGPGLAILVRGGLSLLCSAPIGPGGAAPADARRAGARTRRLEPDPA